MRKSIVVLVAFVAFVGCGGGARKLGSLKSPSGAQQQAATTINGSTTNLQSAGTDANQGPALALSLFGAGQSATAENVKQGLDGGKSPEDFQDPSCAVKSGTSITYNNCKSSDGQSTITGTVSATGAVGTSLTVTFDGLKITTTGQATGSYTADGSVTITPTMIVGELDIKLDATVSGAGAKTTVKITWDAGLSECGISSGTVRIDQDTSITTVGGIGLGGSTHTGGSVEFDYTACNTFMARNS